jgi:hypothetical protein
MPFRRHVLFALGLVLLAAVVRVSADEQQADPTTAPETSTTRVAGTLPVDLRGVWLLAVAGHAKKGGLMRNMVELYRIEGSGETLRLEQLHRALPDGIAASIKKADAETRAWAPTDAEVTEVAQGLDRLPPVDEKSFLRHQYLLAAPDQYATEMPPGSETVLDGSTFALLVKHVYRPKSGETTAAQIMSDDALYGFKTSATTRLEGQCSRILLAAGFIPIPVALEGPFVMHRLRGPEGPGAAPASGSGAAGGWREALGSLFRGCR